MTQLASTKPIFCEILAFEQINDLYGGLNQLSPYANAVEIRFDYLKAPDINQIPQLIQQSPKPVLFTCRHHKEGGQFRDERTQQQQILTAADRAGCQWIDIDLALGAPTLHSIKTSHTILSHHDFDKTPPLDELMTLLQQMHALSPNIIKIATMIQTDEDHDNLLKLLRDTPDTSKLTIVGMGPLGQRTRIAAVTQGSHMAYFNEKSTSPDTAGVSGSTLDNIYKSTLAP